MKKILFGISGIGNGHINRETPIIEALARENEIMIFAHDDSLRVATERFRDNPNIKIVPVGIAFIAGSNTGLDFKATATLPQNLKSKVFKESYMALHKVASEWGKVDLVISDYEPVSAQFAYAYQIPLVTIDQQSKFLYGDLPKQLGGFTFEDEIKRLHMFFPKVDKRIVCSFFSVSSRVQADEIMLVPPTIRQAIIELKSKRKINHEKTNILVYISSAREFSQTPTSVFNSLRAFPEAEFHLFVPNKELDLYSKLKTENSSIYPHGSDKFLSVFARVNGVISTAGHSLLSEAMYLQIPVYAVPIAPYEQHLNAYEIASNNFGVSDSTINKETLKKFINNLDTYADNIKKDETVLVRGVGQDKIVSFLNENFLTPKKKILVFSPPFSGHLNVLKELIKDNSSRNDFRGVITGWKNIEADLSEIDPKSLEVLSKSDLRETDPALWTLPRAVELLEDCLRIAKHLKPDFIIYDFFSIEGYLVGKILNIPYFSSIPALLGPYLNQEYLKQKLYSRENLEAIKTVEEKYGVKVNVEDLEMVSDGISMPGQINLVWSYPQITPKEFKKNRSKKPFVFIGNPRGDNFEKHDFVNKKPLIYFSLGTVVMNNLWNQQSETREKLKVFIEEFAKLSADKNWQIIFVTQGKKVLNDYPENWWIYDQVNQVEILSRSDVFITHGGNNSFHESILQKVPMVAIPFFGDQILVSEQIEKLHVGTSAGGSKSIDTHGSKDFLSKDLAHDLIKTVDNILKSPNYVQSYLTLNLTSLPVGALLDNKIDSKPGDFTLKDKFSLNFVSDDPVLNKLKKYFLIYLGKDSSNAAFKAMRFFSTLSRVNIIKNNATKNEADYVSKNLNFEDNHVVVYEQIDGNYIPFDIEKRKYKLKGKSFSETFYLTSENSLKLKAAQSALKGCIVIGHDPHLQINEQLIGIDQIMEAAFERLLSIESEHSESTIISTVSGLIHTENGYQDVGVVVAKNSKGKYSVTKTPGILFPLNAVQKAKVRGLDRQTVGKILGEEEGNHVYDSDPHSLITKGKQSRKEFLAEAIEKAIYLLSEETF